MDFFQARLKRSRSIAITEPLREPDMDSVRVTSGPMFQSFLKLRSIITLRFAKPLIVSQSDYLIQVVDTNSHSE